MERFLQDITGNFNFTVPADWHGVIRRKYAPTHTQLQPFNLIKFSSKLYIQCGSAPRSPAWLCPTSGGFCAPFHSPVSPVWGLVAELEMVRCLIKYMYVKNIIFLLCSPCLQLVWVVVPKLKATFSYCNACVTGSWVWSLYIFTLLGVLDSVYLW